MPFVSPKPLPRLLASSPGWLALAVLSLFAAASCGGNGPEGQDSGRSGTPATGTAPGVTPSVAERTSATDAGSEGALDPRLADIRRALDAGLPEAAWTLLDALGDSLGLEGDLLRARASLLEGDGVGALREIESAKQAMGDRPDARVLGTEVEILASLDRLGAARDALRAAYAAVGRGAELERARGWVLLRSPGGAREGLNALESAQSMDSSLPFLDYPLLQAHLLVGREALSHDAQDQALAHALLARRVDPSNADVRELEADARAALLDFDGAIPIYEGLRAEGRGVDSTLAHLQQRRGTFLLMKDRRDEAIEAYAAARALGLGVEGLGFGATLLAEEAIRRLDRGSELFAAGDLPAAESAFRGALELDPHNVEARDHLAVCLFNADDPMGAAAAWAQVLEEAEARGLTLPDPVHLNLARAWHAAGRIDGSRRALEDYLQKHPDGVWVSQTEEMLSILERESSSEGE